MTVVNVLGPGTPDSDVVAFARAEGAVLVTADKALAGRLRQRRRAPCLYLRDLRTREKERVAELLRTIEGEYDVLGQQFYMQISASIYLVSR